MAKTRQHSSWRLLTNQVEKNDSLEEIIMSIDEADENDTIDISVEEISVESTGDKMDTDVDC